MIKHELRTCGKCDTLQTVRVKKPNHILHVILSIVSAGAWLVVYFAAAIESWCAPSPRCHKCDAKVN